MRRDPFYLRVLLGRGFSYDYVHEQWYDGKQKVEEDDVLIFLISCAKSERSYRREAGVYAQKWLYLAKKEPAICFAAFKKARLIRNRNRRVAGKDLYAAFREETGDPLSDDPDRRASELTTWCMHIRRFYDLVADGGYSRCRTRARVAGKVLRSVFIGLELRDAKSERVREEADEISENAVYEAPVAKPASRMRTGFEHVEHPDDFAARLLGADRFSLW